MSSGVKDGSETSDFIVMLLIVSSGVKDGSETSDSIVMLLTICEMCKRSFKFNMFLRIGLKHGKT